jgi:hypothetical protein
MKRFSPQYWNALLPVITAFANGEALQFRQRLGGSTIQEWTDDDGSGFSFKPEFEYRVKPADPFRLNTLEEQVELLKHLLNGGKLQYRSDDFGWRNSGNLVPSFSMLQYRKC